MPMFRNPLLGEKVVDYAAFLLVVDILKWNNNHRLF